MTQNKARKIQLPTTPPEGVDAEALEAQANKARASANKVSSALNETSVALATIFNDRYGDKTAKATNQENAILVTLSTLTMIGESGIAVTHDNETMIAFLESQNAIYFVQKSQVSTRALVVYHGAMESLIERLPARERSTRGSAQMFPMDIETVTVHRNNNARADGQVNYLSQVRVIKQARADSSAIKQAWEKQGILRETRVCAYATINKIEIPILSRAKGSVAPSLFDDNGVYTGKRKRDAKVDSATDRNRESYVVTLAFEGSDETKTLVSDGLTNLMRRINAHQESPIRALTEAESRIPYDFVYVKPEDSDDDDDDSDDDDSE